MSPFIVLVVFFFTQSKMVTPPFLSSPMRRKIYKELGLMNRAALARTATKNRAALNVVRQLNALRYAVRRRQLVKRVRRPSLRMRLRSPDYRIPLWNAREEAGARARVRSMGLWNNARRARSAQRRRS